MKGRIKRYCGPETDWQPAVAIQLLGSGDLVRIERVGVRIFDTVRDAVEWARDNGFEYVFDEWQR